MFFSLRILNCLSEYAHFVKTHICLVEGRGVRNVGTYSIVWLSSCFQGIFQLIKEAELSLSGRWFIPLWLSSSLSPRWQIKISQSQSIFKYSLKCFLSKK